MLVLPVLSIVGRVPTLNPFPMEAVTLAGEWGTAQARNQEVLLSLNMSSFGCHFTTTANLTSCKAPAATWHSYQKNSSAPTGYTHHAGFLAAGGDVKPPEIVPSLEKCEAFCSANSSCTGITFEAAAMAPTKPFKCYWKESWHLTPQGGMGNCITLGGKGKPACSPLPGEMGLGGYYGHYQGHWLSATAFLYNSTGDEAVRSAARGVIATFGRVMDAWKAKNASLYNMTSLDGYLFPYDPIVWNKLLSGHGAGPYYSVPFYTLHKLMAGLLDQYTFAGSDDAYNLVTRMAAWVGRVVDRTIAIGGQDLWQRVLLTEWGGMNDVLYNLYSHSADPEHMRIGRLFNGWVFSAPLAKGIDDLAELPFPHANFHLPEVVGFARAYELSGNATDLAIATNFFDVLSANHSYATCGSNSGECWQKPRDLAAFLTAQTEESCTQYNVLKVARRLFLSSGAATQDPSNNAGARFADFYERAILNGIVGNQNRKATGATSYIYMQPLGGVNTKPWGKSDYGFPCCWGTLSESFAKLSDSIYFTDNSEWENGGLIVAQFVDSSVTWASRGIEIEQRAWNRFDNTTSQITIRHTKDAPLVDANFSLRLRVPSWVTSDHSTIPYIEITRGGQSGYLPGSAIVPGTFVTLTFEEPWADGDTVTSSFPRTLWANPINDYHPEQNATLAFMYGPLVLAGVNVTSDIFVPAGSTFRTDPSSFIKRLGGDKLQFEATGADGSKMTMIPLKDVMEEKYAVYFYTAGTKPPQPSVHYCPTSRGQPKPDGISDTEDETGCEPAWPPSAPSDETAPSRRGVRWSVDHNGRMTAHQPVRRLESNRKPTQPPLKTRASAGIEPALPHTPLPPSPRLALMPVYRLCPTLPSLPHRALH